MTLIDEEVKTDWASIEAKMRKKIENQLHHNNHCQMHVRRLGRYPWRIKKGNELVGMRRSDYIPAYALATKLLEEYGGAVCMRTYFNNGNNNCSKVYQF